MTRPYSQSKRGPYKVPRMPCGWCGKPLTALQFRKHWGTCPKKPKGGEK